MTEAYHLDIEKIMKGVKDVVDIGREELNENEQMIHPQPKQFGRWDPERIESLHKMVADLTVEKMVDTTGKPRESDFPVQTKCRHVIEIHRLQKKIAQLKYANQRLQTEVRDLKTEGWKEEVDRRVRVVFHGMHDVLHTVLSETIEDEKIDRGNYG